MITKLRFDAIWILAMLFVVGMVVSFGFEEKSQIPDYVLQQADVKEVNLAMTLEQDNALESEEVSTQ